MEFSYSGRVEGLKKFYLSMLKINVQIGTFEYIYNEVVLDAIFDTRDTELWKVEYYVAAEPPVRCGESHLSRQAEPPCCYLV